MQPSPVPEENGLEELHVLSPYFAPLNLLMTQLHLLILGYNPNAYSNLKTIAFPLPDTNHNQNSQLYHKDTNYIQPALKEGPGGAARMLFC